MIRAEGNQVCQFVFPAFADGRNVMNINERIPTAYHALALKMPLIHVFGISSVSVVLVVRILCAGDVPVAWGINSVSGTKDTLARTVFPLVDQVRLDVERFSAPLAYNRNAPILFLFFGLLEQCGPRLIGAIPTAKVSWGFDVLIALLHKCFSAMLAFNFDILRSRVSFRMVYSVLSIAFKRTEFVTASILALFIGLSARLAGYHGRLCVPMRFCVRQPALVGAVQLLPFVKCLVAIFAVHTFAFVAGVD